MKVEVNDLLQKAVDKGASDLHLKAGSVAMGRIHGHLQPIDDQVLDQEDLTAMSAAIMPTASST